MIAVGAVYGLIGVAFGAFGAHGLKGVLGPDRIAVWETAVLYNLVHALALIGVGLAGYTLSAKGLLGVAGWAFVLGVLVFSGSLYLLALTGVRALGAITPVGGVAFLVGWLLLAWAGWRAAA